MQTIQPKSINQMLKENLSLAQKISYEEYISGKVAPHNSDESIEQAYSNYQKIKNGQK